MCVCMSAHVMHMGVHVCTHGCVYEASSWYVVSSLVATLFTEAVFHWNRSSQKLASSLGDFHLCLLSAGLKCFVWVLGRELQSSCLPGKVFFHWAIISPALLAGSLGCCDISLSFLLFSVYGDLLVTGTRFWSTLLGSWGWVAKGFRGVVWSESRGFICWKMGDFDSFLSVGWSESLTFLEGCVFCREHTQEAAWFSYNTDDYYEWAKSAKLCVLTLMLAYQFPHFSDKKIKKPYLWIKATQLWPHPHSRHTQCVWVPGLRLAGAAVQLEVPRERCPAQCCWASACRRNCLPSRYWFLRATQPWP